ncbi:MAG: class I SAM-dependent methyltransferase [Chloracidobacterium sp.]|nr:class I SAM-dependent methyltransferase [Chloracidobacterium sp.]
MSVRNLSRKSRTLLRIVREHGLREFVILLDKKTQLGYLDLASDDLETYTKNSGTGLDDLKLSSKTIRPRQTSGSELESAVETLGITEADRIIDIGCGKGAAMIRLSKFPFARIDGLEHSQDWVRIARRNLSRLRLTKRSEIYCADATEFTELDGYNYVYLFNPFPLSVLLIVLENLRLSLENKPRKLTIIYNNLPENYYERIVENGTFELIDEQKMESRTTVHIFQNRAIPPKPCEEKVDFK